MKTILRLALVCLTAAALCGCASTNTEKSIRMAKAGYTKLSEHFGGAPKAKLHAATLNSLQERGWKIISAGNPISARYVKGYQRAFLKIEVSDNTLLIDTKGSYWKNEPYVPLNYIKYLKKSIARNL